MAQHDNRMQPVLGELTLALAADVRHDAELEITP